MAWYVHAPTMDSGKKPLDGGAVFGYKSASYCSITDEKIVGYVLGTAIQTHIWMAIFLEAPCLLC